MDFINESEQGESKSKANVHAGHRSRFRHALTASQWESCNEHQLLEYMLSVVIPRRDTNPLAHDLIEEFGSLANVLDASCYDLMQIKGVGEVTATFLHSIPSLFKAYKLSKVAEKPTLTCASNVFKYFGTAFNHMPMEEFHILCVDSSGRLISKKLVAKGSNNEVAFSLKTVLEYAIRTQAAGIILMHNHPNGEPKPSPEDVKLTHQIYNNLMLNGIAVLDHLIVGRQDNSYYSFKQSGLMDDFDKKLRTLSLAGNVKSNPPPYTA